MPEKNEVSVPEKVKAEIMPMEEKKPYTGLLAVMDVETAEKIKKDLIRYKATILKKDVDYGIIKGTKKDTLYKSGAEKLIKIFGLSTRLILLEKIEDVMGKDHDKEPYYYYRYKCELWDNEGRFICDSDGSCNSFEKKYRYRKVWNSQTRAYDKPVKNPDIHDQVNTILKMAQKRAMIAAVLIGIGGSDIFTQDLDDMPPQGGQGNNQNNGRYNNQSSNRQPQSASRQQHRAIEGTGELSRLGSYEDYIPIIREYREMSLSDPFQRMLASLMEYGRSAKDPHAFYESIFTNSKKQCSIYSEKDLLVKCEGMFVSAVSFDWLPGRVEAGAEYLKNENTTPDEPHE